MEGLTYATGDGKKVWVGRALDCKAVFRKALAKPEESPSAKVVFREALSWRGQAKTPAILSH